MSAAVVLYVESTHGRGHLTRAAALARALNAAGLPTTLLTGTPNPPADLDHIPLAPLQARDDRIKDLATPDGAAPDAAYWAARRDAGAAAIAALRPRVFVTETYPFGRPRFAAEATALLDAAAAVGARCVASVRDVLVARRDPSLYAAAAALVGARYARVLIHGDPDVIHFRETFPDFEAIADHAVHTGYVHAPTMTSADGASADAAGEVVVSSGGGRLAAPLLAAARGARAHSRVFGAAPWRLVAGPLAQVDDAPTGGIVIDRARDDLPALLRTAALSVSRCGYNTALDVVRGGARAVFVPDGDERQTEQRFRAERFAARGFAQMLAEADLSPETLAAAVDAAAAAPRPARAIDGEGLARSVAEIAALAT